jgi:hypothetical protein
MGEQHGQTYYFERGDLLVVAGDQALSLIDPTDGGFAVSSSEKDGNKIHTGKVTGGGDGTDEGVCTIIRQLRVLQGVESLAQWRNILMVGTKIGLILGENMLMGGTNIVRTKIGLILGEGN